MRFILFFLLFAQLFVAQTTPFAFNLDRISGLPSQVVFDVFQDSKSLVWFGTDRGICSYDGLQVKNFSSKDFIIKSASNISEDSKGRIWFQDFDGNIYFIAEKGVYLFKDYKANGFLRYGIIDNQILIAGKDEVKYYNLTDFKLLRSVSVDLSGVKHSIANGKKFYLIGNEIQSLDSKGKVVKEKIPKDYLTRIQAPLPVIYDGKLFVFSKFGEYYLELNADGYRYHQLPFNNIFTQNVAFYNDAFWLASTKGIYKIKLGEKNYQYFFPESNISHIIKTSTGNYWITSLNKGAYFVQNFDSNLIQIESTPVKFEKSANQIYFSTNRDEIYKLIDGEAKIIYKGVSDHAINAFKVDSLNRKLLISSSKFIIKNSKSQLEHAFAVKSINQLDEKYYAVSASGWNGILYVDPNIKSSYDEVFKNFPNEKLNGINFITLIDNENGKHNVVDAKEKSIFFLTNYGLKYFKNGKIHSIKSSSRYNFTQLIRSQSNLLMLSEKGIVYKLNANLKIEALNFGKDFTNENIKNIKSTGNLTYFVKDGVLFSYDSTKTAIKAIVGLPSSTDFYDITALDNRLYIATNRGIIDIDKNTKSTSEFLVLNINDVTVNGISFQNIDHLKSNENNIEIIFDIISSMPVSTYKIKYKIDDNPWKTINNTERNLRFASLSYGKHTIILRIEYGENVVERTFVFNIDTPFWLTWWGIALGVLLLIGLIYLYFKNQMRVLNKRNEAALAQSNLEKMVNESKLKSLKSQMNPHFYFNALNTLQSYILSNEKSEAVFYLSKFSRLTRNILDMSDHETQSLTSEIEMLKDYIDLEKIRFGEDFNYNINIDESLLSEDIQIPSLITQPFVENAIKHGLMHKTGDKNLNINFKNREDFIEISIMGNGIGRKRSAELNSIKNSNHKSFATQAIDERIHILNQQLSQKISFYYIDLESPPGTTVKIRIPKQLFN